MAMIYCRECGKKYSNKAKSCPHCGYTEYDLTRSTVIYLLLVWFVGIIGAHRFYAGKTKSGIIMLLLTLSMIGTIITFFWWIYDLIFAICNLGHPENIFENK